MMGVSQGMRCRDAVWGSEYRRRRSGAHAAQQEIEVAGGDSFGAVALPRLVPAHHPVQHGQHGAAGGGHVQRAERAVGHALRNQFAQARLVAVAHPGGVFAGADHAVGNGWRLGGAVGYTDSKIRVDDRASQADV
ncbi:hypothetical protein G6F55_014356 [Rhizopus delemar]|nr:hypothetical protein G6F55_014356 [Rhizopus delemar]